MLGGSYIVRNNKNRPIYYCKIVLAVARVGGGQKSKRVATYIRIVFFLSLLYVLVLTFVFVAKLCIGGRWHLSDLSSINSPVTRIEEKRLERLVSRISLRIYVFLDFFAEFTVSAFCRPYPYLCLIVKYVSRTYVSVVYRLRRSSSGFVSSACLYLGFGLTTPELRLRLFVYLSYMRARV